METQTGKESSSYSVTEVARMFSVHRNTVFKWLSLKHPEDAQIRPDQYFRLPNGQIRIKEAWVRALMG